MEDQAEAMNDDMLSEEERRILSALRDPEKGPLLYDLMNKRSTLPVSG